MLPLFKVFSLLIRVFTRPLVNYTKMYHMGKGDYKHRWLRNFFIFFGNRYHIIETKINRRFMNTSSDVDFLIRPLTEDQALQKGVESFYELTIYFIMISLPMYEMWKGQVEAEAKSEKTKNRFESIENNIELLKEELIKSNESVAEQVNEIKNRVLNFENLIVGLDSKNDAKFMNIEKEVKSAYLKTQYLIEDSERSKSQIFDQVKSIFEELKRNREEQNNLIQPTALPSPSQSQ